MCGIAGVADLRGEGRLPAPHVFDAMTDSLKHRGPDGRGVWRTRNAVLGHRRLAIMDPTPAGAQPMVHAQRAELAVTYNGEIYNWRALRDDLTARGHTFRTACDTEVILASWLEWGPRCVTRMNGIFAFAVVDAQAGKVFLARDHIGVKPLFYAVHDGVLRFGSELKAILADPVVPRAVNAEAVDCFLTHAFVPQPLSPFHGIAQLPPATTLLASIGRGGTGGAGGAGGSSGAGGAVGGGAVNLDRYWRPRVDERGLSEKDALAALQAQLQKSVRAQLMSDVPLGAFLSGGLDSASVVDEMVRASAGARVRTFSMGFPSSAATFDERDDAAHTAQIVGSLHHAEEVALDLRAGVLDIADTNDDLLADSSMLAVDQLCRMTRKHVTVALSGDGADEILGGYSTYAATYAARAWRAVPSPFRKLAIGAAGFLPTSTDRYNLREIAGRFLRGAERGAGRDFASWRIYLDDADRRELGRTALASSGLASGGLGTTGLPDGDAIGRYARALDEAGGSATLLKRMLVADLLYYLPGDMLVKVDRASMRNSLEVRVPFLDPDFVELALALPSRMLLTHRGTTKAILRRHVESRISKRIARGKKRGFNVPVSAAFKHSTLSDLLLDAVRTGSFFTDGPLDPVAVEKRVAAHKRGDVDAGFALYAVLVLALWWNRFLAAPASTAAAA